MYCHLDLRYALPPLINLSFLFLPNQSDSWGQDYGFTKILQYPFLLIPLLVLAIAAFLFLFTSIKLGLNFQPIRLQAGDFSVLVALLLFASIVFPPPLFWFVYLVLILLSPWHGMLINLFKCFLGLLHHTLGSVPTLVITCFPQSQESVEVEPILAQVQVETLVEIEGNDVNGTLLTYPSEEVVGSPMNQI